MKLPLTLSDIPIPQTEDFERQLIADLAVNYNRLDEVRGLVSGDMFANENNRLLWFAILALADSGREVSITTLALKCDRHYFVENIVPLTMSVGIDDAAPVHAMDLVNAYGRRLAYLAGVELLMKTSDISTTLDDLQDVGAKVVGLSEAAKDFTARRVPDVANDLADRLSSPVQLRRPSGVRALDFLSYGGFGPGWLVILAARPGVGKTSIALFMALEAAATGNDALFISIEMTDQEIVTKMLYSTGLVTPEQVARHTVEWNDYEVAVRQIGKGNLWIDDRSVTLNQILASIRIGVKKYGVKEVIIDYLSLIKVAGAKEVKDRLSTVTWELKLLAKELGVPVILLCQLNRDCVKENRHPDLFDLRDCGSIEQDGDMVLMLENVDELCIDADDKADIDVNRDRDQAGNILDHRVNMLVRKNRHGKNNLKIRMIADRNYSNFRCL